jgi:hypothetical protein
VGSALISVGRAAMAFAIANWPLLLVAALATAAYLIYQNWDKISAFFHSGWNG